MITYFVFGVVILISLLITQNVKGNIGLILSFFFIFLFVGFRYNFGNDYTAYQKLFLDINLNFDSYLNDQNTIEVGWVLLNRIFAPLGFYTMILFLAVLNSIVYYSFIVKYVEKKYFIFAVFIYYFNSYFLLVQLSAMRQSLAISLFLLSIDYILKKKYIISLLIITFAYLFHSSVLLLLPILLFAILANFRIRLIHIFIIEMFFVSLYVLGDLLKPQLTFVVSLLFNEQYSAYLKDDTLSKPGFINTITYSSLIFLLLYNYNNFNEKFKIFIKIFIVGIFLLPIGFVLPMSSRLSLYLLPLSIVIYPKLFDTIKLRSIKFTFVFCVILIITLRLFTFFYSDTYQPYYSNYKTIFNTFF